MALVIIVIALIGYLLGSINTSIIVSRIKGSDIRRHGSGNAGLTNMLRTYGASAAVMTLLGDVLKGVIAVAVTPYAATLICLTARIEVAYPEAFSVMLKCIAGGFCVIGHNFPAYFKFKGGKGILTGATVIGMIDWRILIVALAVFAIVCVVSKMVSLSSISSCVSVIIASVIIYFPVIDSIEGISVVVFTLVIGIMAIVRHRSNIKRIINGTERKLGDGKRG